MLQYASDLIRIKMLVNDGLERKRSQDATSIGLMAYSGLHHTQLLPDLCYLLKTILTLTECGFFWSDSEGNLTDAWCTVPQFLSYSTLMSCANYQAAGERTWPTFTENVNMGPICGYLLPFQNAQFYASAHYKETYASIGIKYLLDLVVHDGKRPYGSFLMMRSEKAGRFTPDERKFLEKLIPTLCAAFSQHTENIQFTQQAGAGVAILQRDKTITLLDDEAKRVIWALAFDSAAAFARPQASSLETHLEQMLAPYWAKILAGDSVELNVKNRWGSFTISNQPQVGGEQVVLYFSKKQAVSSLLIQKINSLNLPPVRQMVCLLLAFNYGRKEIATMLGIGEETVASHVKTLYLQKNIKSGHDLLLKLIV